MVVDIDEHLYHPYLGQYLARCLALGVTTIPAVGFEMACEEFPSPAEVLCRSRTIGVPDGDMSKLSVFAPGSIEEVRYSPGGHRASPVGRVMAPARDELRLLHYKLLGNAYPARRQAALSTRLGSVDVAHGWGHHWTASEADLRALRERILERAETVTASAVVTHDSEHWWHTFPRAENLFDQLATLEDERERLGRDVDTLAGRVRALESSRTWRWTAGLDASSIS